MLQDTRLQWLQDPKKNASKKKKIKICNFLERKILRLRKLLCLAKFGKFKKFDPRNPRPENEDMKLKITRFEVWDKEWTNWQTGKTRFFSKGWSCKNCTQVYPDSWDTEINPTTVPQLPFFRNSQELQTPIFFPRGSNIFSTTKIGTSAAFQAFCFAWCDWITLVPHHTSRGNVVSSRRLVAPSL